MKKILIIEDEPFSANRLTRLLGQLLPQTEIHGPLTSVEQVSQHMSQHNDYDALFSDIRLGGRLVFEAFQQVMPSCMVVFTTAYDEYALEAFRHCGISYLLKPIDSVSLAQAVDKIGRLTAPHPTSALMRASAAMQCYRQRILVTKGDELVAIPVSEIAYLRKDDDRLEVVTADAIHRLQSTMGEMEEQLDPAMFFRLNRQYLAHIHAIHKIHFSLGGRLKIRLLHCDDEHIYVSRERCQAFRRWLDQ